MDFEFNVTYIHLGGHVELHKYRFLYFVTMFTSYIMILCGNFIILLVICYYRNLHEPMYIFIAALVFNSVLFSTAVYPKLLIDFLSEEQIITYSACLIQFVLFYSLGSTEFFLLSAMAYDRYVSICKPLQYSTIMTKSAVSVFLVLAWLVPVFQVGICVAFNAKSQLCSFTISGVFCNNAIYKLYCELSDLRILQDIILVINILLLPVMFILFTYTRILIICYRGCREVRKKAAQTCLPHLIIFINYSCLCLYNVFVGIESDMPKSVHLIMTLQLIAYHPLFNPIIYGLKMKGIYQHVKRLFSQDKFK